MSAGECVVLDIDVQGGRQVAERVAGAFLIWIMPPSLETLETRLRRRATEDEGTMRRRLENARREIEEAEAFYPRENMLMNRDGQEDQAAECLVGMLKTLGCGGFTADAG